MIFVTGANGYVGVHLIQSLCEEGRVVRALVRRGCREDEKVFLAEMGAEVIEGNVEESNVLLQAFEGARTIVHLLGSIERPHETGYRGMHTEKTKRLLRCFCLSLRASRCGTSISHQTSGGRVIYLSAIGASPSAGNLYQRTKWESEEEIKRTGLSYVIVRSSLIFGRETGRRDSKLVRKIATLARRGNTLPLIGGGRNRVQPIYIADLVECLKKAITMSGDRGETWEVGGPDIISMKKLSITLLRTLGLERRIVGIPYIIAYVLGIAARLLRKEGNINFEQIKMSRRDNICVHNRAMECIGRRMTGVEEGLRRTVHRFGVESISGVTR